MPKVKRTLLSVLLCFSLIFFSFPVQPVSANYVSSISFVILSKYSATADIGNQFYVIAITSNGKLPTWKSSNSAIASVNTYGQVTAKKSGTATITAKIKNAEASCKVTVNKTKISLSKTSASMERGEILKLSATASNKSEIIWKSSKRSIAVIDENGNVTAVKPGETEITATAGGSSATCRIKVKSPTVKLSQTSAALYRSQKIRLSAAVSSGVSPVWKTNKKSVAVVDESGSVTGVKHGTATITATVDGVSKSCEITVKIPVITLSKSELSIKKGSSVKVTATVSSGVTPIWSSSNSNIVTVDSAGKISALKKGSAYIYASEDGAKTRCVVNVTE